MEQVSTSQDKNETTSDVMNAREVAALLRVGRNAVYDLAGRNQIPHRRVGKHLRFSRATVMRWIEGRPTDPLSGPAQP